MENNFFALKRHNNAVQKNSQIRLYHMFRQRLAEYDWIIFINMKIKVNHFIKDPS